MDKDSTGGTDKRSWRDRLGIGTKEMPRLADEFKPAPAKAAPSPARAPAPAMPEPGAAKMAPRPNQPVAKPAPMAPRVTAKAEVKPAQPAAQPPKSSNARISNNGAQPNEALSERLKAQREAAEKLAEQRVHAARQKAEMAAMQRSQQAEADKPKYSFVEDEVQVRANAEAPKRAQATLNASVSPPRAAPQPPGQAIVAPPRGSLGVERPPLPPRPAPLPPTPQPAPPAFRPPLDGPASSYTPPPPVFPQRQYQQPPQRPLPQERPPYTQAVQPRADDNDPQDAPPGPARIPPRPPLRGPMAGPGGLNVPPGTADDIFERPIQRPSRRVSAGDYQSAYRDSDNAYEYDQPRSSAPGWLLFILALAGVLGAFGVWYYQTQMNPRTAVAPTAIQNTGGGEATGEAAAPVVKPPDVPEKVSPEDPAIAAETVGETVVPATTKKQIYDRIVGDREVLGGQIVPTEEVPAVPEQNSATQGSAETIEAQPGLPEPEVPPIEEVPPAGGEQPLPVPTPADTGSGDQQGSLDAEPATQTANATPTAAEATSAANVSLEDVVEPVAGEENIAAPQSAQTTPSAPTSTTADSSGIAPPPAEPPAAPASTVSDPPTPPPPPGTLEATLEQEPSAGSAGTSTAATPSETPSVAAPESAPETIEDVEAPKPKLTLEQPKKPAAKKVVRVDSKKKPRASNQGSSEPKVLVPAQPAEEASGSATSNVLYGEATDTPQVAQPPRKRTLVDLLNNKPAEASREQVASVAQPAPRRPAAQQPESQPQTQSAGASGFVAQLASFRTRDDATREFARIRSRHPNAVRGLQPFVSEIKVAGSTRYRLAVGSTASRAEANRICSQLLAEGERDCVVRQR